MMNMFKTSLFDEDVEKREQIYIALEQFLRTMNDKVVFAYFLNFGKSSLSDVKIIENKENMIHGPLLMLFAIINTHLEIEPKEYYDILNILLNVIRKTSSSLARQQALLFLSTMCKLHTNLFCPIESPQGFSKETLSTEAQTKTPQKQMSKRNSGVNAKDLKEIRDMLGKDWLVKYVEQEVPPFYNVMNLLILNRPSFRLLWK